MSAPASVDELFELYELRGHERYGEDVSQLEHALQCAALARHHHASDELITAALFHDVGHFVVDLQGAEDFNFERDDDDHQAVGARVLAPIFGPLVAQPVALHVTAKRWRCTREPAYVDQLSPTSRATLRAQGGLLTNDECERFEAHPGFATSLALRGWDDTAKQTEFVLGSLRDYEQLVRNLARPPR